MGELISKFYMDRDNKEYFTKLVDTLKKNKFCKFWLVIFSSRIFRWCQENRPCAVDCLSPFSGKLLHRSNWWELQALYSLADTADPRLWKIHRQLDHFAQKGHLCHAVPKEPYRSKLPKRSGRVSARTSEQDSQLLIFQNLTVYGCRTSLGSSIQVWTILVAKHTILFFGFWKPIHE